MSLLSIIVAPDPRLKVVSTPVDTIDDGVRQLMEDMLETVYDEPGIGLSAVQVGIPKRIVVVDVAPKGEDRAPIRLVNPEVFWHSDDVATYEEGCLSLPEHYAEVDRPEAVKVRYFDEHGRAQEIEADGILSRCLQHEIDHLDGILFVDHLTMVRRSIILRKLAKLKKSKLRETACRSTAMAALKLAFMGAARFAVPALDALAASDHNVAVVYSQPPRPAGRGRKERPTPVHARALELGLSVVTPVSLRDGDEQARFAALELDAAVVVAYGLILPQPILAAPRLGCLNIHPSLLPRWRGAAPLARAILAGDAETGVSIILMDEGLDTGPILAQTSVPMPPRATTGDYESELAGLGAAMLVDTLDGYNAGKLRPQPQDDDGATYAHKFSKQDGLIDWTRSSDDLDRQARALSPWPGVWFPLGDSTVRVLTCEPVEGTGEPGTLLDKAFTVACGEGALRLQKVQRAGKAAMAGADFLRGTRLVPGTKIA